MFYANAFVNTESSDLSKCYIFGVFGGLYFITFLVQYTLDGWVCADRFEFSNMF